MMITTLLEKFYWKGRLTGARAEMLQVPEILCPLRFPYGPFKFKSGLSKQTLYEVQATTNLKNWRTVFSGAAKGEIEFLDSEAPKFSYRFYRLNADGVFSRNIVGYVAVTLPPGFSMIANPLECADSAVATLFRGMPDGAGLSRFKPEFQGLTENKVGHRKWRDPTERLSPGEGAIFFNPTSDYRTVSFVGNLISEGFAIPIHAGFSIRSSPLPQPGQLDTDLCFPIDEGDVVHLFDRDRQTYVVHPYAGGRWVSSAPLVGVGESFWIAKKTAQNWVRKFSITQEKERQAD